jgi:hypothetical protein
MGRAAGVVALGLVLALGGSQGACAAVPDEEPGAGPAPPTEPVADEAALLEAEAAAARERAAKAAEEARRADEKALRARRRALERELAAAEDALDAARDAGDAGAKERSSSEVRRLAAELAVLLARTAGTAPAAARPIRLPAPPRSDRPFESAAGLPPLRDSGRAAADAVPAALDWLARHQSPAGHWDGDGFAGLCRDGRCPGPGGPLHDAGLTGLATLAFLGAGETHKTPGHGETVRSALRWLKQVQDPEGAFGDRTSNHFTHAHAVAALAMAEAYGLTQSPLFRGSAEAGVRFILRAQNPYLGWRYGVKPGDNDTQVTGWMVLALSSARSAGLSVPEESFQGALAWFDKVTEPEWGRAGYTARGNGPARPQELMDRFPPDRSESPTAVAVAGRLLAGQGTDHPLVAKGLDLLARTPPAWDDRGSVDFVYWYFGSLASFRGGGARWAAWSEAVGRALGPTQRGDDAGCARGSWDPVDPWGADGGRVYSTAINALTREIELRYARAFGVR